MTAMAGQALAPARGAGCRRTGGIACPTAARLLAALALATAGVLHAQIGQLTCGTALNGNFSANVPQTVKFTGDAGESVLLRVLTTLQPTMEVRDSLNNTVSPRKGAQADALAGAGFIQLDLPTAGDYQVNLKASAAGPYQIALMRLNRPCPAVTLGCGTPARGSLAAGQIQSYQFSGKPGDQVSLRIVRTGGDSQAAFLMLGFDSVTQLQPVGDKQLPFVLGNLPVLRLDYKLTSDGPQTIVITETTGKLAANYSIAVIFLNRPCSGGKAIGCGTAIDDSITDVLATNIYTFSASAGDLYQARVKRTDTDTASRFQPAAEVFDPQGNTVNPTDVSLGQFRTPVAGTYTVLVEDGGFLGTGKYALSLARLNSPCSAQPLGCGSVSDGRIDGALRLATYSLGAGANDVYLLRLVRTDVAGQFRPLVDIYGPDGAKVQSVTADAGSVKFTTAAAGAYTLLATDGFDGAQSGTFSLSLARLNRPCDGSAPLACGTPAAGTIDRPLKAGLYSYAAAAGDSFTLRLVTTSGSLQSTLQVYDAQGNAV